MWMLAGVGDSQSGSQTFWRKDDVTLPAGSRPAHFLDFFSPQPFKYEKWKQNGNSVWLSGWSAAEGLQFHAIQSDDWCYTTDR